MSPDLQAAIVCIAAGGGSREREPRIPSPCTMKQRNFALLPLKRKKKQTRRERFLAEMEAIEPV